MSAEPATRPSLGARFARGAAWSAIGAASGQAFQMVGSVLTARILGAEAYGQLGIVMSTAGMFGVVASFGMGLTATRFVARHRESDPVRAGRVLALALVATTAFGFLASLAMALASHALAQGPLDSPGLVAELRMGALFLGLNAVAGTLTAALTGLEAFRAAGVISFLVAATGLPIRIAGAMLWGVGGGVWALTATAVCSVALSALALRRALRAWGIGPHLAGSLLELPVLWRYSFPALLTGALSLCVQWLANAMLVATPSGYAELGVFSAATQWRTMLLFVPTVFGSVALPIMSAGAEETGQASHHASARAFELTQALVMLTVLPLGCALLFVAGPVLALYGPSYLAGRLAVIGSIAAAMAASLGVASAAGLQATARMWRGLAGSSVWAVCVIVTVKLAAERWGAAGLAFGHALGHFASAPLLLAALGDARAPGSARSLLGQSLLLVAAVASALAAPPSLAPWLAIPAGALAWVCCWRGLVSGELRGRTRRYVRERLGARRGGDSCAG